MRIKIATLNELDNAVDFAYELQTKIETRCRPLLVDCKRNELYNMFQKHINGENQDLILVYEENELVGMTPYYWMTEDLYVTYYQGIYAKDYNKVATFIMNFIEENYKGYKFYVNTAKEHITQVRFYEENNFTKIEDATMLNLKPHQIDVSSFNIELLNDSNKEELYKSYNTLVDGDTYWNVERLNTNLERFIIIGIFDNGIQGHIVGRKGGNSIEMISLLGSFDNKEKLLKALINESYNQGIKVLDLYTEEQEEVEIGKSLGFIEYDNNVCFIKYL